MYQRLVKKTTSLLLTFILLGSTLANAQTKPPKKYPSLFWEITGNGLKKPSYLFGTMHISSKMVFHLSDSFFIAIKNSDVVGLELNSETWQSEMVEMEKQRNSFYKFYGNSYMRNNYDYSRSYNDNYTNKNTGIDEETFKLDNQYINLLKFALKEKPYIINSLLYRTMDYKQDFEENTFLDMYIFQTGKKLGKKSAGMETIFTMEKYTTEAEIGRATEKRKTKKTKSYDNMPEMSADEAYRKGDLDMLDSIDKMYYESEAYVEKFLYQRNDVQAHSMDTIMKKGQSLFVGVGAAHLPGERGVIEILRRMGYKLRPIKMLDRDAAQREKIDKIRVPVKFQDNVTDDNFIKVRIPGKLYERQDGIPGMSLQYADMSNGAYYTITRIPTVSSYFNITEKEIYDKLDSLLYENVPGKIIKKQKITKNGYTGMDITNKTRRGDIQRYNIFITPYEVIFFKMSGNENYVEGGTEASDFFNSIVLQNNINNNSYKEFKSSNYSILVPSNLYHKKIFGNEMLFTKDNEKQIVYQVQKRLLNNQLFEPVDTFNIMLMEESFIGYQKNVKTLSRNFDFKQPYTVLNATYNVNDSFVAAKYIVNSSELFLISAKGKNKKDVFDNKVLSSFKINTITALPSKLYVDTFLNFSVKTPFVPVIVDSLKELLYKLTNIDRYSYKYNNEPEYQAYGNSKEMTFSNDSTGEVINVVFNRDGKYEFLADSLLKRKIFRDSLENAFKNPNKLSMYLDSFYAATNPNNYVDDIYKKYIIKQNELERIDGYSYYRLAYTDTGSTKLYKTISISKDDVSYRISTITDTSNKSTFVNQFFESFTPLKDKIKTTYEYGSKVDTFFADYYSKDTATRKFAKTAINDFDFCKKDVPKMVKAFNALSINDKDYFDTKNKWIRAIADIDDSTMIVEKLNFLKKVYDNTADTSIFQNTILQSLINLKTKESYALFKQYLLQDPPVTISDYDYGNDYESRIDFFGDMDSLELAKTLFPEILQLTTIDDYEGAVMDLLKRLVDSSKITAKEYESYSSKLLFDAKIAFKKQLIADEKMTKEKLENEDSDDDGLLETVSATIGGSRSSYNYDNGARKNGLIDYVTLLMPFYESNAAVPNFINKLWSIKDESLKYDLLLKMLKIGKKYPDSLLQHFAKNEIDRGDLYYRLAKMKKENLFPAKYLKQDILAKAFLYTNIDEEDKLDSAELSKFKDYSYSDGSWTSYPTLSSLRNSMYNNDNNNISKLDSILFIKKDTIVINDKLGLVYIYKYREKKEDKWRLAFSGLQPLDGKTISYKNFITTLAEEKINDEEPLEDQIKLALKKIRFKKNPWSANFYNEYRPRYNEYDRY